MASSWILRRALPGRAVRYHVRFRLGGAGSPHRHGGAFVRKEDALTRKRWIDGQLAAMRVPDVSLLVEPARAPTLRELAQRWRESRVDVSENTKLQHRSAVANMLPTLGDRRVDSITPGDVADLVAVLGETRKRETVRKTLMALAMVLDYAGVSPNPARDKVTVKLPREERTEIVPPTAAHVLAAHELLARRYRLPLLVLDATGMRLGELEGLAWGDVDEELERWRVSQAVSKTRRARWVTVPPPVFAAVLDVLPRDDRSPGRPIFQGFARDAFRTAIARACTAAGVPVFSPHDLRHRRISLMHLSGVPWARIGEHVGQRSLSVTANTYSHVLVDRAELDYAALLRREEVMTLDQRRALAGGL